jgi:hypothetical protein
VPASKVVVIFFMLVLPPHRFSAVPNFRCHAARLRSPRSAALAPCPAWYGMAPIRVHPLSLSATNFDTTLQPARALFAERRGLGACVRVREIYRLSACMDRLLRPEERQRIAERCAILDQGNGAGELAAFSEEMAYSRKVDRR